MESLLQISTIFQQNNFIFIGFSVFLGLLIGSFLNVVIYRLPKMMEKEWENGNLEFQGKEIPETHKYNLVSPRSACMNCGHQITAVENIPVISYLLLKGKCKGCQTKISPRYPLIEIMTGALSGLIACHFGYTGAMVFASILMFALVVLTFIDFDTMLLPDSITLPLIWIGLLFNLNNGFTTLSSAVIGAMAGYLFLWSIYWLFKLTTGKEGMGYGDFKLLAALGAWFGFTMLPAVIILSSVLGTILGISMMVFGGRGREQPMPFGPFLAIGGIACLFFGQQLSGIYL